jgi:hypothetical protein
MHDKKHYCALQEHVAIVVHDCEAAYASAWRDFWAVASPRYEHVLLYAASDDAIANVPSEYKQTYSEGKVVIFSR